MELKGICIQDYCLFCDVGGFNGRDYFAYGDPQPLTDQEVEAVRKLDDDYCQPDGAWHAVPLSDLEKALSRHKMARVEPEYDDDEELYILQSCLKHAKHYLLYGAGMTWNGCDAYNFVDDLAYALYRGYETSDTIVDYNGRCLELCESSHDVPTGAPFYIIGIGERTKRTLESSDFQTVKQFVEKAVEELHSEKEEK